MICLLKNIDFYNLNVIYKKFDVKTCESKNINENE